MQKVRDFGALAPVRDIYVGEEVGGLYQPEVIDNFKETEFSGQSQADAHINSQIP